MNYFSSKSEDRAALSWQSKTDGGAVSGKNLIKTLAIRQLEQNSFEFISREGFTDISQGAGPEKSIVSNCSGVDQWQIIPRMFQQVGQRDMSIKCLGRKQFFSDLGRKTIKKFVHLQSCPSFHWEKFSLIRENRRLPIVWKGNLHPNPVQKALEIGVDALLISEQEGRQKGDNLSLIEVFSQFALRNCLKLIPLGDKRKYGGICI